MRVLLVYTSCLDPRYTDQDHAQTPVGLFYLGAMLISKGHDVRLLNACANQLDDHGFVNFLREFRPGLTGFSVFNANRFSALQWCETVSKHLSGSVTVFGGVAATFMYRHFLTRFRYPDYIIRGEGEIPLAMLAGQLADNALKPETIPGLAWRDKDRIMENPPADFISNLDSLPDPARYYSFSHVILSRGCPGNCSFCASPRFWNRRTRFHSADYFFNQLSRLRSRGITYFNVSDDTFTLNAGLVREVCQKIINAGLDITWAAISRVDRVDQETLGLMRRAGCIQISFGVESGSARIRNILNKGFSDQDIIRAFELCKKHHILPRAYFIYASPGEDSKSIKASADLIKKIKPLGAVFYILHLFPGTALYDQLVKKFDLKEDIWLNRIEELSYHQLDKSMSSEQVMNFGRTLRSAFYRTLPLAAAELENADDEPFPYMAADFFSRLGLTLIHGDFSRIREIPDKQDTAKILFEKSLKAAEIPRAYLGLGLYYQKNRDLVRAEKILGQGLKLFPNDQDLMVCMAVCLMNTGRFDRALDLLLPHQDSPALGPYIEECRKRLRFD